MSKFKEGDKLRILVNCPEGSPLAEGDIVTHSGCGDKVYTEDDFWFVADDSMELVESEYPDTPAGNAGLKVGDKVEVIDPNNKGCYAVGSIITLISDDGTDQPLFEGKGTPYRNGPNFSMPAAYVHIKAVKKILVDEEINRTEEKAEMTNQDIKVGDKVRIKENVENFTYGLDADGEMLEAQQQRKVLTVEDIIDSGIYCKHKDFSRTYSFFACEIVPVEVELKPFAVLCNTITPEQANLMLSLAVKAGADVQECVYLNDQEREEDVYTAYPELEDATMYNLAIFDYIGVDSDFDTYITDNQLHFNENILTYQEAIDMLNSVLGNTSKTPTEGNEMTNNKSTNKTEVKANREVKGFYVPMKRDANQVNAVFKRLEALGVKIHDVAVPDSALTVVRREMQREMGGENTCSVDVWELIGVRKIDGVLSTHIADFSGQYDDDAVAMTWEEMESYITSLEKPVKIKKEAGKLFQRKVKVVYTNDKQYHMKNVVSLVVNAEHKSVNVTYSEKKGRVEISSNVRIPFSEVKMVRFEGPDVLGATYNFRDGEVVSVTRDHKYQAFSTTQH